MKFWKYYGKPKSIFSFPLSYWGCKRFALMRGFQIWSQNWVWILFDPYIDQKTVEIYQNCDLNVFCCFSAKLGSNIIKPQFWDHIWNPLIKANLLDPQYESGIENLFLGFLFLVFEFRSLWSIRTIAGPGWVIGLLPRLKRRWANHHKKDGQ